MIKKAIDFVCCALQNTQTVPWKEEVKKFLSSSMSSGVLPAMIHTMDGKYDIHHCPSIFHFLSSLSNHFAKL